MRLATPGAQGMASQKETDGHTSAAVEETQCPWEDRGTQDLTPLATNSQLSLSSALPGRASDPTPDHLSPVNSDP